MLFDAAIIMCVGMLVVLAFLVIMVLMMNIMSGILRHPAFLKMFPETVAAPAPARQISGSASELEAVAAAIAIAKAKA